MDRESTITIVQPPHLQAEPDIAGFEHLRTAVVFDRIALADERLPGTGLHIWQGALYSCHVGGRRDVLISSSLEHLRKLAAQDANGPPNWVTVRDRIHPAMHPHATANTAWGRELRIFRTVDIASLEVEAVETQQRSFLAANIGRHVDGDTLVGMILDVGIPQLMSYDEGQG